MRPHEPINAEDLANFLNGILEGREARFKIQKKAYARKVKRVPIKLQDLYQFIRDRSKEPIIVTDPAGIVVYEAKDKIAEFFREHRRINVLAGSRVGVPKGVFRFADLVLDLCPGLTFATEHTIPAFVSAIVSCIFGEEE